MTEPERVDGRIRDLADLCTRHGTPCADGLLAEIGRLRTERDHARDEWHRHNERADMWRNEERITREALSAELARTEGDLGVAIREAAHQRENVERVRELHQPATKQFLVDGDCGDGGVCDHDDTDCPVGAQTVCAHCFTLGDSQSEWETNIADAVLWPCPTAVALDSLPLMSGDA